MFQGIRKRKPLESNFELQITALVDTLVIILLFLLKSVATESLEVEQAKSLAMPTVQNGMTTGKSNRLDISKEGIFWNGTKFVSLSEGMQIDRSEDNKLALKNLGEAISTSQKEEKTTGSFEGKLLLQADKDTPFPLLKEVLSLAKNQGYKDIRFVGAKIN